MNRPCGGAWLARAKQAGFVAPKCPGVPRASTTLPVRPPLLKVTADSGGNSGGNAGNSGESAGKMFLGEQRT